MVDVASPAISAAAPGNASSGVVGRAQVTAAPCVLVRGLTKAYGRTVAVDDLDLEVFPGEVVGFLGPNGAGKTTVLRVLMGQLRPTAGVARVGGMDPFVDAARVHRQTGYVAGDLRLPSHLTGRALLRLCSELRGNRAPDLERLVDRFGVPLDTPISSLSKGNRQKVGLVQALMSRPDLLLLDEPSSGLDPLAQEVLEDELRNAAGRGAAVILSSHVLREVEDVADRVVMLRAGCVLAGSTLSELRAAAPYEVAVTASDLTLDSVKGIPGVADVTRRGRQLVFTASASALNDVLALMAAHRVRDVRIAPADLESLFLHYYQGA
jgi:ABC-2 type transport system ATP-binding protein